MSNCIIYALWKWVTQGGWIVARRSRYWPGPHVYWTPNLVEFYEYVPVDKTWYRRVRIVPPVLFRGEVRFVSLNKVRATLV